MKFCTNLLSIIFFHITNPFVFTIVGIVFNDRLQKTRTSGNTLLNILLQKRKDNNEKSTIFAFYCNSRRQSYVTRKRVHPSLSAIGPFAINTLCTNNLEK